MSGARPLLPHLDMLDLAALALGARAKGSCVLPPVL
jgi:hypothetical protein